MKTLLASFLLSFFASLLVTPLARRLALRWRTFDAGEGGASTPEQSLPRLGGLAIVFGFFVPTTGLLFCDNTIAAAFLADLPLVIGLFGGGLVIAGLGVYDDLRGAGAALKLSVQVLVALLVYLLGFRIEAIANPFADSLFIGWLSLPVTLLWIVGITNAMNLIDGLDGLASSVAFVALATTLAIAFQREQVLLYVLSAAMAGAVLGFMPYNLNPARIFMGDCGSMFLGFTLALTTLRASQKSATTVALLVPAVALALPITDTLLAVIRRLVRGQRVFAGDRDHIHHRLLARGLSQSQVLLLLGGGCALLGLTALVLTQATGIQAMILLAGLLIIAALTIHALGYTSFRPAVWRAVAEERRRNRLARLTHRWVTDGLRQATSEHDVRMSLRVFGETLGCSEVELVRHDSGDGSAFCSADHRGDNVPFKRTVVLTHGTETLGEVRFCWRDGRQALAFDQEAALKSLCRHAARALSKLAPVARGRV